MNDVLLYIRNFAYSHDSADVSAADRAKQYKNSEVFEDGGKRLSISTGDPIATVYLLRMGVA